MYSLYPTLRSIFCYNILTPCPFEHPARHTGGVLITLPFYIRGPTDHPWGLLIYENAIIASAPLFPHLLRLFGGGADAVHHCGTEGSILQGTDALDGGTAGGAYRIL